MGLRFRKSFNILPGVKINLNKKSAGVTLGTKGVHYTINTSGKRTASVSLPGTGLSYSTSSGGGKKGAKKKTEETPKAKFNKVLGIVIAVVAVACVLYNVKGMLDEKAAEKAAATQTTVTTEAAANASAAVADTAANTSASTDTVWISESGSKYHTKSDCSGMEGAKEISLQEALDMGKEAWKRCD